MVTGPSAAAYETRLLMVSLAGEGRPSCASSSERSSRGLRRGGRSDLDVAVEQVIRELERGTVVEALLSQAVKRLLLWEGSPNPSAKNPHEFYRALASHFNSFLEIKDEESEEGPRHMRCLLVLTVGISFLLAFWQANVTGPPAAFPSFRSLISPCEMDSTTEREEEDAWNAWAKKELMVDGCDLIGSCSIPQYLILANLLLVESLQGLKKKSDKDLPFTTSWWACRTHYAHQRILAERSSSLYKAFTALETELLNLNWENLDQAFVHTMKPAVQLEFGLAKYAYGHLDHARQLFSEAREACGLQLHLTGILGYRTIHQAEPKAQMVLLANSESKVKEIFNEVNVSENNKTSSATFLSENGSEHNQSSDETKNIHGESDILMIPKLVGGDTDKVDDKGLSSFQQAVILAHCLEVKKSNPDDEMRGWQMAPFIEAVDSQQSSKFMIRVCCQLFRIRWECTRNRTKHRALVMLEKLIEDMRGNSCSEMQERMCYSFCVQFPTVAVLRKEYAEMLISLGLVREALPIFEELELWNSLIDCYCLLEKKSVATSLIKKRLEEQPEDPRLWCALGDVTLNEDCYLKAWEVSGHRFGRAQRSLGRSAYNKGEYVRSVKHWQTALALNPMHPDGWFALGSAALKARDLDKAVDSFTHAVQLDPENGEAWNNIAAIHITKKKSKPAFVAFREALKFKRRSWQMWENYAYVALDIRNFAQAIEAFNMVLDLSQGKRVIIDGLTKLVEEVEGKINPAGCDDDGTIPEELIKVEGRVDPAGCNSDGSIPEENCRIPEDTSVADDTHMGAFSKSGFDDLTQNTVPREWLLTQVGKLLSKAIQSSQDGLIWGLSARWHRVKGDLMMCSEALLKQVRSLQGSAWQNNIDEFQKLCQASLQLCDVYMEASLKTGSKKELYSAQMLLKNLLKQGAAFSNTDNYAAIEKCLSDIQHQISK